jgi:hypothetical protein
MKTIVIKLKILNKKVGKNQFCGNSGLIPLTSNPGDGSLIGAISVSLSLLKVVMLGCVVMDIALPCPTSVGGVGSKCLSSGFSWCVD